jgi:hypothetical protein
LHSG